MMRGEPGEVQRRGQKNQVSVLVLITPDSTDFSLHLDHDAREGWSRLGEQGSADARGVTGGSHGAGAEARAKPLKVPVSQATLRYF